MKNTNNTSVMSPVSDEILSTVSGGSLWYELGKVIARAQLEQADQTYWRLNHGVWQYPLPY